jgi:replicative DNA helicase
MLDPVRLGEFLHKIDANDFYDQRHANLFQVMLNQYKSGKPIDPTALHTAIKDLDTVGGIAYVCQIQDTTTTASNISYYADVLKRKRVLREFNRAAYSIRNTLQGAESDEQALEDIQKLVRDVLDKGQVDEGGEVSAKDAVYEAIAEVEAAFGCTGQCVGVPTGFASLDLRLGGLHDGEMVVLAARPSMGKTSLAMNIVEHAALNEKLPVGVFSLEMTATSLMKRAMAGRSQVDSIKLRDGNLTADDLKKLTAASAKLAMAPIYIIEKSCISTHEFRNHARRMKSAHDIKLLVVDYIQLMSHKADSRTQEITKISNTMKGTAKELGIPVLALSQLSRASEQQDRPPRLSDLRESGAIEQDADVVAFLSQPEKNSRITDVMIAKNRNGPVGSTELEFIKEHSLFRTPKYEVGKAK